MRPPVKPSSPPLPPRDRILQVAQDLFYRHGVRATGVDRVIAEAGVTKVTFYRNFPSKDDLIRAFLQQRHEQWITWFKKRLAISLESQTAANRKKHPLDPLLEVAGEWFNAPSFRGCAFANTVAEVGHSMPSIIEIAQKHKREVQEVIEALLPRDTRSSDIAWAATLALDGAIVNAQFGDASQESSLRILLHLLRALEKNIS
ncbi:TetR/AcrR family transcriptional regulator [Herbaspirillum sp. B65]|uniref:TetR/AcrR family transcriptional regulator n=1 Tax=Herbaspirillum sp. B65 TaxID=137708 RepID=UPI0005CB1445|nr:TetR/AcrR family transcriptional regulator [Herbaspirillum sp. B65]